MHARDAIYCEATLNYSGDVESHPVKVAIHDGRAALAGLVFDRCGFTLIEHHSKVSNWMDESELAAVHVPEVEAAIKAFIGCDVAISYPPLVRSPESARKTPDFAPIEFVHSDYTDDYGKMIKEAGRPYRAFLDPLLEQRGLTTGDIASAERIAMIQFWRNVGARYPDYPLAYCDAQTVPRRELQTFMVPEYGGEHLEFETFGVMPPQHSDDHAWYTYPGMTTDEVVMLRTYDSLCEQEDRPFWTPHSAFRDPMTGDDPPRRASVEMRVLCLFGL